MRGWLDQQIPRLLARTKIPGAAATVVSGGKQVASAGYGVADMARDRTVQAGTTPFPIDSVSKTLTATAVLQLVEKGELHLDRDVNDYLRGFRVPDTFPGRPITIRHLLTHTAGFEERNVHMVTDAERPKPLADYLPANMPARVRPPGELPAYSNFGFALLGRVVELRSGTSFEDYMRTNVFEPLGMNRSTFVSPRPATLGRAAPGYRFRDGRQERARQLRENQGPAGSATMPVTDIARFMIAHLNDGRLPKRPGRILESRSVRAMHRHQFTMNEQLGGMGLSFFVRPRNGTGILEHGGDGFAGSHSLMLLAPGRDVGMFVALNGDGAQGGADVVRQRLTEQFVDRFGEATRDQDRPTQRDRDTSHYAGSYQYTRVSRTDVTRLFSAVGSQLHVAAQRDGTLTTTGSVSQDPARAERLRWRPLGGGLFQAIDGGELLAFDQRSERWVLASSEDPSTAWVRTPWHASPQLHLIVAAASLLVLATVLVWPAATLHRRVRRPATNGAAPDPPARTRRAQGVWPRRLAGCTTILLLGFTALLAVALADTERFQIDVASGSTRLVILLALPLLGGIAALGMTAVTAYAWCRNRWSRIGRIHYTAVTLAAITFVTIAVGYNLHPLAM